jgi:hypothetical protein
MRGTAEIDLPQDTELSDVSESFRVRPNGRPHSAGVGVAEHNGYLYFTSGPETRKSRNLAWNPACALSRRLDAALR